MNYVSSFFSSDNFDFKSVLSENKTATLAYLWLLLLIHCFLCACIDNLLIQLASLDVFLFS